MSTDKWMAKHEEKHKRESDFLSSLSTLTRGVFEAIYADSDDTRFLKLSQRTPGWWSAVLGSHDSAGQPIVAFGSGSTSLEALLSLEKSLRSNSWKVDRPYNQQE